MVVASCFLDWNIAKHKDGLLFLDQYDLWELEHRYLSEYQYRFNHGFVLTAMLPRLIKAVI